jgi:D-arabinose 1-dehydrogenase-like Zn-dependent alcohol dehydrogenase
VQERRRVGERVVDVGFGGEVHDGVGLARQAGHQVVVCDVALDEANRIGDAGK